MEDDRDLERRVERLEDGQRAWFEMANFLRRGQDAQSERLDRIEGDIGTLKTDMTEVKGQLSRLELAMARNEDNVAAQFEWLRGHIARREQGES
jgi:hypothetical protein